jgi:Flp pilus assembly protein TadD
MSDPSSRRRKAASKPNIRDKQAVTGESVRSGHKASVPLDVRPTPRLSSVVFVSLALVALTAFAYAPVRHNDFIGFDDPGYVTGNPHVSHGLSWTELRWALTAGYFANWHPLTWWSHMVDVELFGMKAGPHHLMSLAFHISSTLLLLVFLYMATRALFRSAFVAAAFALHPLHVESVAWVAERKDVLSAFFWFLTCCAYVWYTRQRDWRRYLVVAASFALGLMAKPMLVTLPFVLLLLDLWPLGRARLGAGQWGQWKNLVTEKIPLLALAAGSSVITFFVQRQSGAVQGTENLAVGSRIGNALVSYAAYIKDMLWPSQLAVFYPFPTTIPVWLPLFVAALLVAVTVAVVVMASRRPYLLVGWFWYLGTLVPVIGLVQVGEQSRADRYTYIPLVGLFVVAAWGLVEVFGRKKETRLALSVAAALVLIAMAVKSHGQVYLWRDSVTLWTHTVAVTKDNHMALNNLGFNVGLQGKHDEAIAHYREALRIRPSFIKARTNLALEYASQGQFAEAAAEFKELLVYEPLNVAARGELAFALARQGKEQEAVAEYTEALRLRPDFALGQTRLGNLLLKQGKYEEAAQHYEAAVRLGESAEAHNNLGVALAQAGKVSEAKEHFSAALRIDPAYQKARDNLALAERQR